MEKIRLQILVDQEQYTFLNSFCIEYQCKNMSEAVSMLITQVKRLRVVISNLEKAAWEQTNIDRPTKITKDCGEQQTIKGVKE